MLFSVGVGPLVNEGEQSRWLAARDLIIVNSEFTHHKALPETREETNVDCALAWVLIESRFDNQGPVLMFVKETVDDLDDGGDEAVGAGDGEATLK